MNLELIKSKHGYKIISKSIKKHPALLQLGKMLMDANKYSPIKIGLYTVTSGEFSLKKTVFSYLSNKTEKMDRRKYNKWLAGDRQIYTKKVVWDGKEADEDIQKILEGV